ncbi:protein kinase domain-containing protein [Pseudonocardia sp.]|uniref:protein kinase domain-containing protein n=1 Tax=Pseudonocardia sp. TaxID=60912 RepID=UPI003D0B09B5
MAPNDFWIGPAARPDTYRLIATLGGGGEGEVWQAVLPLSAEGRSMVAVKILHGVGDDEYQWQQFGHLLRSLSHPGLVRVTDVFSGPAMHRPGAADPGSRVNVVVMDYIDGPTLREWCDENPQATAGQRLRMLRMVAAALDEMHSGRHTQVAVAHGDVKPSNIVVRDGTGTVLVDLGLARLADSNGVAGRSAPYAAPELRSPRALATPEADRYAFAVTTAQVLTGQAPPTGPDGWLDRGAIESLLRLSPVTARRPMLVRQILQILDAPPEARPRALREWLDSAADALSQFTTGGEADPPKLTPSSSGVPVAAAEYPTEVDPPHRRRRRRWPLYLAAGVALVVAGAIAAQLFGAAPLPGGVPAGPSGTETGVASGPTSTSSPNPPEPTDATGLPLTPQFLDNLRPVDTDSHIGHNGGWETGPASTSGTQHGHAVSMAAWCSGRNGGDYWIDYDLARDWNTFTATVGLRDDDVSDATASYKVLVDNQLLASGSLTIGKTMQVNVPVTGALRLRLLINNPTVGTQNCTGDKAMVLWGSPTLTP